MGWQQVEQDPLVRGLERLHVVLLLLGLQLPQEVQPGHPFDLAAMESDGNDKQYHDRHGYDVQWYRSPKINLCIHF